MLTPEENLSLVSNGQLYHCQELAKIGCHDCAGCHECCTDMGTSILTDPYDVHLLTTHLHQTFDELLLGPLELHLEEGLILPNLSMVMMDSPKPQCSFLNEQGRCLIHPFRPSLCRLFPLGRNYTQEDITYFVLTHECPAPNKTKVKISKWLDIPSPKEHTRFLLSWHALQKELRAHFETCSPEDPSRKDLSMKLLKTFYQTPFPEDFYPEFHRRVIDFHKEFAY